MYSKRFARTLFACAVMASVSLYGCGDSVELTPYVEAESTSVSADAEEGNKEAPARVESASEYENIIITEMEYEGVRVNTYAFPGVIYSDDGRYAESMSNGVTVRSEIYKSSPEFALAKKKDELLSVIKETADNGSIAENQLGDYVFSYDYNITIGDTIYPCRTFLRMDAISDSASLITSVTVDTSAMTGETESVAQNILSAGGFC